MRLLPTFARCASRSGSGHRTRPRRANPRRERVALFPTCLVEYQAPDDRQGAGRRVRAQRLRVRAARRSGVLRHAVARRRRPRAVPRRRAAQCRSARCRRSKPDRSIVVPQPTCAYTIKDEYPAFLGTDAARKVAGGHVRRVGVPDGEAPRRRSSTPSFDGQDLRIDHVARRVPLPRPADRAEEPRPHGAHRRRRCTMVERCTRDRRHVGAAGRERRARAACCQAVDGDESRESDERADRGRLPARQRRDRRGQRQAARSTRCRCSPAPTESEE